MLKAATRGLRKERSGSLGPHPLILLLGLLEFYCLKIAPSDPEPRPPGCPKTRRPLWHHPHPSLTELLSWKSSAGSPGERESRGLEIRKGKKQGGRVVAPGVGGGKEESGACPHSQFPNLLDKGVGLYFSKEGP